MAIWEIKNRKDRKQVDCPEMGERVAGKKGTALVYFLDVGAVLYSIMVDIRDSAYVKNHRVIQQKGRFLSYVIFKKQDIMGIKVWNTDYRNESNHITNIQCNLAEKD